MLVKLDHETPRIRDGNSKYIWVATTQMILSSKKRSPYSPPLEEEENIIFPATLKGEY